METMSYHVKVERANRVRKIVEKIGIGQIIKETWYQDKCQCITDTGITIVKSLDRSIVITMYVTSYSELVAAYHGEKKIPPFLKKKVNQNQSRYIREGKTIWR